ncbi:MAG: ribonuclease E/G, partial [Planctomycetes bacterium]|nr:ribonuclease E/G [Planctomycetota bacterium]
ITDSEQRERLRELAESLEVEDNFGVIVRTAGQGRTRRELERDLRGVKQVWSDIARQCHVVKPPALLLEEADLVIRTVRDLCGPDVEEIVLDDEDARERVATFLDRTASRRSRAHVRLHSSAVPIFHRYGIEGQIESIYDRKVALPSGGSLVIDETEALVAIDVNSGRSRDQEDLEETALLTNTEAAEEIARQLRLRDIGGVVVCDFIDMLDAENRRRVETALRDALRRDRSKTWLARMSRFGLIEMTRQRLRPSKDKVGRRPCPTCQGRGSVRNPHLVAAAVLRQLRGGLIASTVQCAEVWAGPHLLEYLANERREGLLEIETQAHKPVTLHLGAELPSDGFEVRFR